MKTLTLLLFLVIVFSLSPVYAQPSIDGPSESCPGESKNYQLLASPLPDDCFMWIESVSATNGTVTSQNLSSFTIRWENNNTSSINGQISVRWLAGTKTEGTDSNGNPYYFCDLTNTSVKSTNKTILIHPTGNENVSTPNPITNQWVAGNSYKFSTSSSNADRYQWQVTGGNIQGGSTGSTIQVLATSCNITIKARGLIINPCKTNYSNWRTLNFSLPTPLTPTISGPGYLYPNQTATYSASATYGSGYTWTLTDNYGKKLSLLHNYGTDEVQVRLNGCVTTYYHATLSVRANNFCASSPQKSTGISYGALSCSSSNFLSQSIPKQIDYMVYPNPSLSSKGFNLKLYNMENLLFEKIEIIDSKGEVFKTKRLSSNPENNNINISGLSPGVYFLKLYDVQSNVIETERLIVE